ncbi:MAG: 3-keto-5-aminohexanoate cleavage protein [Proteobacteria bacterium]|nr:3-keto-5-aminohexanoate cleavage protein [Pseudomonadota bacterium]
MPSDPLIITCALVGAEQTRETYPFLPLSPEEIAVAAEEAVAAGATVIHLHVRDAAGKPSQQVEIFAEVSEKIRRRCDCILQYSTGGAVGTPLAERCAPLQLRPEMATLSMGTMNFGPDIYENSESTITAIASAIKDNGIMAELEVFDVGMFENIARFAARGILPQRHHVDFVLGVPGGMAATIGNLVLLVDRLAVGQSWTAAALGRQQLPLTTHAIAMGGHVRVGIEDNIYYRKGELVRRNAQLVDRVARLARELERPIATVQQARAILGLKQHETGVRSPN